MVNWKTSAGLVLLVTLVAAGMPLAKTHSSPQTDSWVGQPNSNLPALAPYFIDAVDTANDVGQHVSLALDPVNGTAYISYYDATSADLRMAHYVGPGGNCGPDSTWTCETVDSGGDVGKYSSIAVDPTDNYPIIAYYDGDNGALKLAIGSSVGWIIKTINDPLIGIGGLYTSLALDNSGNTHIAYYLSNLMGADSLWYVKYVGGGAGNCTDTDYQCDLLISGDRMGKYPSLGLDGSDQPRIAFYAEADNALRYAYYEGGSWEQQIILPTDAGKHASLFVDTANGDLPHIAHYDSSNGTLEYAVFVGPGGNCGLNPITLDTEWQCGEIESVGTGAHPRGIAIAVDKAHIPVIAYQSGASILKVARPVTALGTLIGNCGPATPFFDWQCDSLSFGVSIGQGDYISLAINSSGLANIAFYGNSSPMEGDLFIAYQRLQVFLPMTLKNK